MGSLYTDDVKAAFRTYKKPFLELDVTIVEYEYWLTLRLSRANFESFPGDKKKVIMQYVTEVMETLTAVSVVPVYLEVV